METRDIVTRLNTLSEQLGQMQTELETIIDEWGKELIKNQDLQMENHYLRERVNQLLANDQPEEKEVAPEEKDGQRSPALQNLLNIYEDGFHICNISYGQRRENAEQCMFCLDILYGVEGKR
ncbi:DNA replication initiation control protein YabA [Aerococcus tenax]|uniref:DNA replication initiation control protein YabA n=1 Tax=Aerococcus tenax TaxID=3078812 RepID=UPI0018A768B2|nr:DNA replication initiation control protein YabA [Aerococcus tenax]